jgi:hypothetical protein
LISFGMSFVDIARRLVLRTNDWPGLRGLYHEGYEFGLSLTTSGLKSLPDVLAVLLRVGEEGRTWVPGLSDYDLTVLTERVDSARMIGVLENVWRRYRRIKRAIPQLGETEIMNVEEYVDFLSWGPMPTASLKHAEPLFVRPGRLDLRSFLQCRPRASRERELLLDALSRYIWFFFPAWLRQASGTSHSARRRAEHLLGNVVKRLQHLEIADEPRPSGSFADRAFQVFGDLSRACRRFTLCVDAVAPVVSPGPWSAVEEAIPLVHAFSSEVLREAKVPHCSVILWISYMSADKLSLVFVMPDETPGTDLGKLVATLGRLANKTDALWKRFFTNGELQRYFPSLACPVVMSRSMWKCWRELSPFDGAAIVANGRTLMGPEDTWPGIPSRAALKQGAEVQYAALLPLKNNWRPLGGSGTPRLYAAMVNYVKGYASGTAGTVLTSPTTHRFASVQDGYRAVCEELKVLRQRLSGPRS